MSETNSRVALVTGASRGIGRAIAAALAQAGMDVAVNYRVQAAAAEQAAASIRATGRRAMAVQADVSRSADVNRMVDAVSRELGPIEILVNNAGIARMQAPEEITEADWDDIITVNLKSAFLVTQAVLPEMRRRGWGRIVNISSGAAQTGGIVGVHYTASKAGMDGLTRAYASRLVKEGVTVNAVAPALIHTDMTSDPEELRKRIPMGRLGRADEVAQAVAFLVGNDYTTGQTVHVNGGLYYR
jgi:3-oxoacyl-[acyl-carrier protein] reductase